MAATIKIKNSSTAGAAPTSSDLVQGELAVNVTDKRLFTENASGTVVELGTNPATLTVTAGATIQGLTVGKGAGAVSTNTAVGASALAANTTGTFSTAVGYEAGKANTNGYSITAVGARAGWVVNGATNFTAVGTDSGRTSTTAASASFFGANSGFSNTTGSYLVAVGDGALYSNTTASNNTAVGYQAGYANTTGNNNVFIGAYAGNLVTTGLGNTFVGRGPNSSAGDSVTTGSKNTIIGAYTGNNGGLDIRTASNKTVLSDGDGNPVFVYGAYPYTGGTYLTNASYATLGVGGTGTTGTGALFLNGEAASGWGPFMAGFANSIARWYAGSNSWIKGGTAYDTYTVMAGTTGGVNLTSGATSWTSASDERLKDIIEPISDGLNKVASLRAVIGKYKDDETAKRRPFLIAQDVQVVLPEAISESRNSKDDETEYLQLAYTEVIPLLVAAIKELKAEIDTLKGQA